MDVEEGRGVDIGAILWVLYCSLINIAIRPKVSLN